MQTDAATAPNMPVKRVSVFFGIPCPQRHSTCRARLSQEGQPVTLLESLDQSNESDAILIVHMAPADALAYSLENGRDVSAALDAWMRHTEIVLDFFRRNRERTRLVRDTVFLESPAKWIGRDTQIASDKVSAETLREFGTVTLLLASEVLRRNMSAMKLVEELEASAVFTELDLPELDLELVHREQADTASRLQSLKTELTQVQEEQEAVLRELVRVQEKAASALDAKVAAERLENQLHQMRQGLESTEAQLLQAKTKLTEKNRELGRLTARLKKREEDLAKFYASKSYRMTRPLRLLRAALFQRSQS